MKSDNKVMYIRVGSDRFNELKMAAKQHGMAASALARVVVFNYLDTISKKEKN